MEITSDQSNSMFLLTILMQSKSRARQSQRACQLSIILSDTLPSLTIDF
jgi:hypothetical protein